MNRKFRTYEINNPKTCEICGVTENTWMEGEDSERYRGYPRMLVHHILYLEIDDMEITQTICYPCHAMVHSISDDEY
jgi:hypothetical protein